MLISHLLLKNFGKFGDFSCDFGPGLNLIKGPNEAGKSTLANAITAALFTDPGEGTKEFAPAASWNSKELPLLEAIFNVDGKAYKLKKDFKRGKSELEDKGAGIKNETNSIIDDWLKTQLGMSSEQIFKATACIGQGDISHIEDSFEAIKDKLESLVTGGREEAAASQTISRIEKRINQISGDEGSGGLLGEFNRTLEGIEYNIDKINRAVASLKAKRVDLIQVEMAHKNVREDLASKKAKLELSKKATKLEGSYQSSSREFHELEGKLKDIQESLRKIKTLRDRQAGLKNIDQRDVREIETIDAELNYLQPKRRELEADAKEAKEEFESYRVGSIFVFATVIGALGLLLCGASYFTANLAFVQPYAFHGLVGSIMFFLTGLAIVISRNQHRKYLSDRSEKLDSKLAELDVEIQKYSQTLRGLLSKYVTHSAEELRRNLWQFDDIENQIAREKEAYESLLQGQPVQELERRYQVLQQEMAKSSHEKKDLTQHVTSEDDINRQTLIISQFEDRLKDLERERAVLRQQIETTEGGWELLASYVERQEIMKSRIAGLLHDVKILRLTSDCIDEARQNVLVSTLEALNSRTSDLLHRLTSGRYSRVEFDKSTMKFKVYCDQKGEWIEPESGLSDGTIDQIYLAARLALADLVSEQKNPLMILDDPFVSYDEKRLENAMKVLKELSENRQILLLTSQNHYDKWADSTITL
jgi:DNA repair exonuclease SbcCD ATPase subunit